MASRFFWAPTSDGAPYITSLGLQLPYGRRPSESTDIAPMTNLSSAWRAVTIAAIADLLFGMAFETKRLPSFARMAFRQFELEPTVPDPAAPSPAQVTSCLKLRPELEYRQLASDIPEPSLEISSAEIRQGEKSRNRQVDAPCPQ